jgi:LacI family transcriptional regulator
MTTLGPFGEYKGRPTLSDVARSAGVSIKTVSRVVNGEANVRESTAVRVKEAIDSLGYEPNELARNLKGQRSRTIALVIADISNPFYAECAKAVELVAREHGYTLILSGSEEDIETEQAYVRMLARRQVEGLLLVPADDGHGYLGEGFLASVPVVALDRPLDDVSADTVIVQNRLGAKRAVEHLIGHGHTRIAYVGAQEHLYTNRKRLQGYRESLGENGLKEMARLEAPDIPSAAEAMRSLLELPDPPTAVFAMNNLATVGILKALEEAGLSVPDDVALVGFDDFELADVLHPRLTLVRQPAFDLGWRAAELLFERLLGKAAPQSRRVVLETRLVVRESCGCRAKEGTS